MKKKWRDERYRKREKKLIKSTFLFQIYFFEIEKDEKIFFSS